MVQLDRMPEVGAPVTGPVQWTRDLQCVFSRCSATVELIGPGDPNDPRWTVPSHHTEPGSWFGPCPGSLLSYPLNNASRELLAQQAAIYDRMYRDYEQRDERTHTPPERGRARPQLTTNGAPEAGPGRHTHEPVPDEDPRWFTGTPTYGAVTGGDPGPVQGRPVLRLVPDQPAGGSDVTNVAEIKAAIAAANMAIAEAQAAAAAAMERFDEAIAQVSVVRDICTDTLSIDELGAAKEACETASQLGAAAIDINATYGGGL